MSVTGDKKVMRKLEEFRKTAPEALAAALYQEGFAIMASSVQQAPREFGNLRRSSNVAFPVETAKGPVVLLSYGTNYALVQHERLDFSHPKGGNAKFLSGPVDTAKSGYKKRLAARTQQNINQGIGVRALRPYAPSAD